MTFSLLYQDALLNRLNSMWQAGRFPHALLLVGAEGSGKRTAARYAAAMLLCRGQGLPPCGKCPSCRKLSSGSHPDFTQLLPEGKSKTIGVDRVREIKTAAYISAHEAPRKVFFIPEAERLRKEAQNALLKIIEEPPEAAYFIFTASGAGSLLETLCSRLTVCPMAPLNEAQRLEALRLHEPQTDENLLKTQAALCETVGQALGALNDADARRRTEAAAAILSALSKGDRYETLRLFSSYEKDREQFLALLAALRGTIISGLSDDVRHFSPLQSLNIIDIIDKMALQGSQNVGISLICAAAVDRIVKSAKSI